jgi:apolipoprotein N-acyltransferase
MTPVALMKTTSLYTRWGEWPLGMLSFGLVLFWSWRKIRAKNRAEV